MVKDRVSIVVPYKNLYDLTQVCVDSISNYTYQQNVSIILVNDGSEKEYLVSTRDRNFEAKNLYNEKSVGWCKAVNQGCAEIAKDSKYIVLLNNDTVVTPGWLDTMIAHLEQDENLGVIGPTTNRVWGHQHVDYNKEGVNFQYADALMGFCLVLKRDLFDKLLKQDGFILDERFGIGGQDDSDLCFRAQRLGYKVGIARDSFIYHYGSATFRQEFNNDIEYSKKFAQSRMQILQNKYQNGNMNREDEKSIHMQDQNVDARKPMIMIAMATLGTVRTEIIPRLVHYAKNDRYNVIIPTETPVLQPLDNARNWWVKKFLEISNHPDDRLFFIDDDIIPPYDALDRLAGHDVDAVGATCFVMKSEKGDYFPYPVALRYNENKEFIVYYGQGLEKIDGTGGGCVMVKRKVYESMDRPYEYKYYPDGTLELVADFHFCQKLAEKGFQLWYDFTVLCDHIKPISIKGVNDLLLKVQNPS